MNKPSKHLSWKELACKDGTPYPKEFVLDGRWVPLVGAFELIRATCGGHPIKVNSAYRTKEHNTRIGGARNSLHLEGRALDLVPPNCMRVDDFYNIIKELAEHSNIKGIGKYKTFVHIDVRDSPKIAYWFGSGTKDA